jgi:hypothetical protein
MYRSGPPMMSVVGSVDRKDKTREAEGVAWLVYTSVVVNNHKYSGADKFRECTVYTYSSLIVFSQKENKK